MYSKEQIEKLKTTIPIWLVAESRLKGLTKRGDEVHALCPYHDDHSPSFQMYRGDDGVFLGYCQACGVTKNIFQLIQDADKVSFQEAIRIVEKMIKNPEWEQKKADVDAVFQNAIQKKTEITTVPTEKFESYIQALKESPTGQNWLKTRGISSETAEMFSLGYVQKPLPSLVPTNHPWYDKGWILFPEIRSGQIISVKYRSVMGKRISKTETSQAWSGFAHRRDMVGSTLYNLDAISSFEDVLIVEGEPDCLVLAQAGFTAVSLPSAGFNPTPDMRMALMRSNARYLAGDSDDVGVIAMNRLFKELGGNNFKSKTYLLQWPKPFKDANEVFLKVCHGDIPEFKTLVLRLMDEAKSRQLPGIQDLKTITRTVDFKPTHDDPRRLFLPWPNINKWVDILPGEVMYMFATETKMGKSTWLMNILMANVLQGKKVINFSAELSPERYAQMTAAYLLQKNRKTLTKEDYQKAALRIPEESFYIGYKPGAKLNAVIQLLENAKQIYGGDIFVVDPLHFLVRGVKDENAAFALAMRELVDFSIKWNVIVIVVGQARKSMNGDRGRMATGQDARGTAAQGEDAATTWILHRDRIKSATEDGEESEPVFQAVTKVKLDYARFADPMSTKLTFNGTTATFLPYSPEYVPVRAPAEAVMI